LALRGRPERDQFRAEAIADLEEALSLLPAAAPERAAVLGSLAAAWLVVKGDYTMSRQAAEQAIEAAKANHDDRQRADAMVTLASATFYSGDRDAGIAVMMEGLALARQADDTDTVLRAHVNLSDTLRAMGRLAEAIDVAREGSKLAEQLGSRLTAIFVTANLAEALIQRGDWDDAEAVVADALTIAPQGGPEASLRQNLLELA